MEMLQFQFILASLLVLNGCFFEVSCQTVYTYTTKDAVSLPCTITDATITLTWTEGISRVLTYHRGPPPIVTMSAIKKYENFFYTLEPTFLSLDILKVEDGDGGNYLCTPFDDANGTRYDVIVEVIPDEISLDCFVPPAVTCPAQGVTPTSELACTCAATGVRPESLSLDISDAYDVVQDSEGTIDGLFDLSLKATVPVTDSATNVTCSVEGYSTTGEPIPPNLITKTLMISPPTCTLDITFDQDCKGATLNCDCSASPTAGELLSDKGMVYSYFNATGHLIAGNATNTLQIDDVEAGVNLTYSCRGCNGLYYGDSSYVTNSSECTISTTALPTTTITTVPLSTNEPTSTKATDATTSTMHSEDSSKETHFENISSSKFSFTTESTTEEPKPTPTKKPGGLTTGAKIGISLGAVAVVVVIVVVAVILWKNGEDDSKPSDDKLDDNGAGPRGDPEIPAYGVVDKNRTKDPTPAPRSSMRDSKNPSNPKQDGPLELQYAALDHGNKPPSDEVRKPKEEPTEYATVQSVIV